MKKFQIHLDDVRGGHADRYVQAAIREYRERLLAGVKDPSPEQLRAVKEEALRVLGRYARTLGNQAPIAMPRLAKASRLPEPEGTALGDCDFGESVLVLIEYYKKHEPVAEEDYSALLD